MPNRPRVGITIGDTNGVGPEVLAKAVASEGLGCIPVAIGPRAGLDAALAVTGLDLIVHPVDGPEQATGAAGTIDLIDVGTLGADEVTFGHPSAAAGRAVIQSMDRAFDLAKTGQVAATVMGPVDTGSIKAAGLRPTAMDPALGPFHLLLASGPLKVVHLTDHMRLRDVLLNAVTFDAVLDLIRLTDRTFRAWGYAAPRLALAGINPHAVGPEESEVLAPAVAAARADGIDVSGPISPDSVFRHCIEGRADVVVAHYHDQGHIAMKTWGFAGSATVFVGLPFLHLSVAHGSAYDLAGRNAGDPASTIATIRHATSLATRSGFADVARAEPTM